MWWCVLLSLSVIIPNGGAERKDVTWLSETKCLIRPQFLEKIKQAINCTLTRSLVKHCSRNITVLYSELPPYVYRKNGTVRGMMVDFLENVMINTCCIGCTQLYFYPPMGTIEKFDYHQQLAYMGNEPDFVIPIENGASTSKYFGVPYVPLFVNKKIAFITEETSVQVDVMSILLSGVYRMLSFFAVAISLAVLAGTIMWNLDTWGNKSQFPRAFLRGSFEGFWWAYVSMTTVGYGDSTPSSVSARLFAVVWILIGITIFNVYTASITSILTNEMGNKYTFNAEGKKVGILANTTAGYTGTNAQYAIPVEYGSVPELVEALEKKEIYAVAMVDHMAFYYLHMFQNANENFKIKLRVDISGSAYGLMTKTNISLMLRSYLDANEDTKEYAISISLRKAAESQGITKRATTSKTTTLFNESDNTNFLITAGFVIVCSALVGCLGVLINIYVQRRKSEKRLVTIISNSSQPEIKESIH